MTIKLLSLEEVKKLSTDQLWEKVVKRAKTPELHYQDWTLKKMKKDLEDNGRKVCESFLISKTGIIENTMLMILSDD